MTEPVESSNDIEELKEGESKCDPPLIEGDNMQHQMTAETELLVAETELAEFEISSNDIEGLEEEKSKGSGAYGVVYEVTVRGIPRIAKRLHNILVAANVSHDQRQSIRKRFLNECLLLSKLDHPNIVRFIGVHFKPRDRSDVTLIMERLHMDLENFLNPNQRPNIDLFTKLSILLDVSSGLLYLHTQLEKPLIHRDLTAGNVLLTEDFKQAKIADLGVSKLIENFAQRAATPTVCPGTPAYMPPEALFEKPKYSTPLDVFSFGQLALYVALQQFPKVYEISCDQTRIKANLSGEVEIFRRKKWIDKLPEDHCLRELIQCCLKDNPERRLSTKTLNEKMKVLCGKELDEFEINDIVGLVDGEGCGCYGAVYEVIAEGAPRIAKRLRSILLNEHVTSPERQYIEEKFRKECLSLSRLVHPNIMKFVGVYFNPVDRSDMAAIFEHLHLDLEKFLNPNEYPDIHLNTKLSILRDVSSGLLYLHTQLEEPLIHRDLTAMNVLLSDDNKRAKIGDLGISKLIENYEQRSATNTLCLQDIVSSVTQAYMPPEALCKDPTYGTPLDVFSFGQLALYVALEHFPEVSSEQKIEAIKIRDVAIFKRKKWIDELPQDHCLRHLILGCLKDEPKKRPSTREVNDIMNTLCGANDPSKNTKVMLDMKLSSPLACGIKGLLLFGVCTKWTEILQGLL